MQIVRMDIHISKFNKLKLQYFIGNISKIPNISKEILLHIYFLNK